MVRRRSGFTLIEMLVVIAVILMLIGIGVIGFMKLDKVAGEKATAASLAMCASIQNEYEVNVGSLEAIETTPPNPTPPNWYWLIYPNTTTIGGVDVNVGSGGRYASAPSLVGTTYTPPGPVYATGMIFQVFSHIPNCKAQISQIPGQSMLQGTAANANSGSYSWLDTYGNPLPVVVDAWKNPIIYVPRGGLNVWIGGQVYSGSGTAVPTTGGPWAKIKTVTSVDGRPFWASAGQDGRFDLGDDNIYSCPVKYFP